MLLLTSSAPVCEADYESKSEYTSPDETYYDIQGNPAEENKTEGRSGGGGAGNDSAPYNVSVDMLKKESSTTERGSISFPYIKYGWSIGTWYLSSYGLRFYNVVFNDEKILYDYRLPWVKIDGTKYSLTSGRCIDGPDLFVWHNLKMFKVWAEYLIASENVTIQVYVYFFEDGEMDPWAIVDCHDVDKDIVVAQRFDFDLGGADDDNAEFYVSTPAGNKWELVELEDHHRDSGNPDDSGVQWTLYDTDVDGMSYIVDQGVEIIPYHPDDSNMTILRYHSSQIGQDPGAYDNDEPTGLYSSALYDPYIGYDLVAWYVSEYKSEDWCNPGPWMLIDT